MTGVLDQEVSDFLGIRKNSFIHVKDLTVLKNIISKLSQTSGIILTEFSFYLTQAKIKRKIIIPAKEVAET